MDRGIPPVQSVFMIFSLNCLNGIAIDACCSSVVFPAKAQKLEAHCSEKGADRTALAYNGIETPAVAHHAVRSICFFYTKIVDIDWSDEPSEFFLRKCL
jgi:hypothetical protein